MDKTSLNVIIKKSVWKIVSEKNITPDSNLFEKGLDSINFIRLIVDLEDELDIEIQDEDISLENFSTLSKIREVLAKYRGEGSNI